MKKFVLLLGIILVVVAVVFRAKYGVFNNGFDRICLIYEDVFTNKSNAKMPVQEKHYLVNDLIKWHVWDAEAIMAFTAVANADPDMKYDLFKQSAEYSIKREWDCTFIKELGNTNSKIDSKK